MKVNPKRLAFSLSFVGAILAPLSTGSLMGFIRQPMRPAGAWHETVRDPRETREAWDASIACAVSETVRTSKNSPITGKTPECEKMDSLTYYPLIDVTHPYPASIDDIRAGRLIRDIALGAIVPALLVLVLPPIARRYWLWLTS